MNDSTPGAPGNDAEDRYTEAPNMIERLENLIAALDEADTQHVYTFANPDEDGNGQRARFVQERMEDARGIAGEILTMVDGR